MTQEDVDFAGKFWDIGNYVAGFAALQMVALLLAVAGQCDFRILIRGNWRTALTLMIVFNLVVYIGGVWRCSRVESHLRGGLTYATRRARTYRMVWIAVFTVVGAA